MVRRDTTIDVMRAIGLMLIILAHVSPPNIIFQLRTFDVPMMLFVSGMSYFIAAKKDVSLVPYVISRFKRLVLPAWIFITIFFICIFVFNPEGFSNIRKLSVVVSSYTLNGFGYFWIIRIFLIIAVLSPFFVKITDGSNARALIITIAMLLLASVLSLTGKGNGFVGKLLEQIIIPTLSYGAAFIIGYKWLSLQNRDRIIVFLISAFVCLVFLMAGFITTGTLSYPQDFKYPPSLYFIAYSFAVSIPIYFIISKVQIKGGWSSSILLFISSNTIWIYLWHIPIVEYFNRNDSEVNFVLKYAVAFFIPALIVSVQVYLVKKAIIRNEKMKFLNVFRG